jgi:hypothetical protein
LVPFSIVVVICVSAMLHVSPFMPLTLIAVYPFAERAVGIRAEGLEWRILLLCGFFILTALVHSYAPDGYLFDDERVYDEFARAWAVGDRVLVDSQWPPLLGLIYRGFGVHFIYARWLNALAGALLVGLLVDVAHDWDNARARVIYWLAGLSPTLLVFVVGGLRDLYAALGVALVATAWLSHTGRWRRVAIGAALVLMMIPVLGYFILVLAVALCVHALYTRETAWAVPPLLGLVAFLSAEFGLDILDSVRAQYFSPATLSYVSSGVSSSGVTGQLPTHVGSVIPAIALALFSPIWLGVTPGAFSTWAVAIGGFGWWLLLPLVMLGARMAWKETRGRVVIIWGVAGWGLASLALFTVVRDLFRLRLVALGAFFLLAWWGLESPRGRIWMKRWLLAQPVLIAVYWLTRVVFPDVFEFVHKLGV